MIKNSYRFFRDLFSNLIRYIIGLIPKDRKLIIYTSWFGLKFADNTRYQFEYMLQNSEYINYWLVRSQKLYKELKKSHKNIVYSRSIKGVWYQVRAIALLSTVQISDYNNLLLSKCIFIDLGHGHPIKDSGFDQSDTTPYYKKYVLNVRKFIDYYMITSSQYTKEIISKAFCVNKENIIVSTSPRIDSFFDDKLSIEEEKRLFDISKGNEYILYMPTHRSCGNVSIEIEKIFDLDYIDNLCNKNNINFIIKKHFYHKDEKTDLKLYKNIIDVTDSEIDTQVLLKYAKGLVSDYSAAYIDYLVLDRPIILYAYDYESFKITERNFYIPFSKNTAGVKVFNRIDFNKELENIINNNNLNADERRAFRRFFFDDSVFSNNSRMRIKQIIDCLINERGSAK